MGDYWSRVWRRALVDTLKLFGWGDRARLALRTGILMLTIFVAAFLGAGGLAGQKAVWIIYAALGTAGAFLVVLFLYFVVTPHRLDEEIREERDDIKNRLHEREIHQGAVNQLQAAYDRGTEIQNSPGLDLKIVRAWCADTQKLLDDLAPSGEAFMFRTFEDGAGRLDVSQIIPLRQTKLRLIIARMSGALD